MVAMEATFDACAVTQPLAGGAGWTLERLIWAAQQPPTVLEFDARLNVVVAADGALDATLQRLRGALDAEGADGTHVELRVVDGPALVLFRPFGGRHRLIDVDSAEERPLSSIEDFREAASALSATGAFGSALEVLAEQELVYRLSQLEQRSLWTAAERVMELRAQRDAGGGEGEGARDDSSAGDHTASHVVDLSRQAKAQPPRRGLLRRRGRTAGNVEIDVERALLEAERAWHDLAGLADAMTALCHRDQIEAAAGLSVRLGALAMVSGAPEDGSDHAPSTDSIVQAVCALIPARRPNAGPHVVAVPGSVERDTAALLLDTLGRLSERRQIIVVTADDAVIDWARLEHHARRATLLHLDAVPVA